MQLGPHFMWAAVLSKGSETVAEVIAYEFVQVQAVLYFETYETHFIISASYLILVYRVRLLRPEKVVIASMLMSRQGSPECSHISSNPGSFN